MKIIRKRGSKRVSRADLPNLTIRIIAALQFFVYDDRNQKVPKVTLASSLSSSQHPFLPLHLILMQQQQSERVSSDSSRTRGILSS